jgi:hypothetical protein
MKNDKIKAIAQITLANSNIIGTLSGCFALLTEQILPLLPDKRGAASLRHELEQIQAHIRDLQPALDLARKEVDEPDV